MADEKRMAGEYEIIQSVQIGDRQIVLGENQRDTSGMKYMCAFCERNLLLERFYEVLGSDDFPEVVELFGRRVMEQARKTRAELDKPLLQGLDDRMLTASDCTPISHDDDLHGRIIVIKPDALRREYRRATHQLKLCVSGFGAFPNSRGTACICFDLYTGKNARYERMDVLGTLEPEELPGWARDSLAAIRQEQAEKKSRQDGREVR